MGGLAMLINMCIGRVEPNEWGLWKNDLSGEVAEEPVRGGIHWLGPIAAFVKYPATQMTMYFDSTGRGYPAIQARTGDDVDTNAESGGQPITISCAFQYQISPARLRELYMDIGDMTQCKERWHVLAQAAIVGAASNFSPQQFWTDRKNLSLFTLHGLNSSLYRDGFVEVVRFEIMKLDFATRYETAITNVQVATQERTTNQYRQQVMNVVMNLSVIQANNTRIMAGIAAEASREAKTTIATARRYVFNLKQRTKATDYHYLQGNLSFTGKQMAEYFKIKSLQSQSAQGKLVVGLPSVTGTGRTEL